MTWLLDGLASVEVEVDEGGEQARGGQQQQHLQQTILHYLRPVSITISVIKAKHAFTIPAISLLEFFIFFLKPNLYFPIPTFSTLFQPIFYNFTIFWVSEDHPQLFSILCLGESQSLASFKATVHCQ